MRTYSWNELPEGVAVRLCSTAGQPYSKYVGLVGQKQGRLLRVTNKDGAIELWRNHDFLSHFTFMGV